MTRLHSRFITRRASGGDRTLAVQYTTHKVGRLLVAQLERDRFGFVTTVTYNAWGMVWGASSSSPQLLRRIRVVNLTNGAGHLWLGIMTTPTGSPSVSNAFLAYNTAIADKSTWEWEGATPLIDRYVYAKGDRDAFSIYMDLEVIAA